MANLKLTFANLKTIAPAVAMLLASSNLAALGLGSLEVQSNLDQPFDGAIELRVAEGDDLGSVVASIASQEDFENLNIDYPSYLADMTLTVDSIGSSNVLRISSNDVVIKEPFIHFLVRVDWSGGSFLREYTALIDPPVYASETPRVLAPPRVVGSDQSYQPEPEPAVVEEASPVAVEPEPQYTAEPEPSPSYVEADTSSDADAFSQATDAQYGPVNRGESLSEIASDLQRQFPDLSIYQIMKVLFEENPNAFIDNNINGLLEGVVLNVANLNVIRSVDVSESKEFFYDQVVEWDPSSLIADSDSAVKVGQDDYLYNEDALFGDDVSSGSAAESAGQGDTFLVGSSSDTQSFVSAAQGDNREGEVIALQQQVTELQTSLSSSSLENQELRERISILEGQLADMNRLMSLSVEDADLATLESDLANQNNASDLLAESELDTGLESELADGSLIADGSLDAEGSLEAEDSSLADGSVISEIIEEEIEEVDVEATPPVVSFNNQSSFVDNIKESVVDSGLWKVIAGIGAVIAAGLGLFFVRRRRADEEFEVSMMTIESHDTSSVTKSKSASSISPASDSSAASVSKTVVASAVPGENEETSFLTVYSDSDAVVQADEVDPIAEADVYIAYGRDEQAEEVLLDGIASNSERTDIKHKLLALYHKNSNNEGFERIAEELYAQKDLMSGEAWQEVCVMGKEILPENPMFELSASELFVDNKLESELSDLQADEESAKDDDDEDSEEFSITSENYDLDAVADESAKAKDNDDGDDEESIHLVNFDEKVSEIDDVRISSLDISDESEEDENVVEVDLDDIVDFTSSDDELSLEIEPSADEESSADEEPSADEESSADGTPLVELTDEVSSAGEDLVDEESDSDEFIHEVSDLDIDADYDEARTQYELAKVFVDLGDEDGARKILNDIVDNRNNGDEVVSDAAELLETIGS